MRELSDIKAEIEKRSELRLRKRKTAMAPLILAAALIVCVTLSAVMVMSTKADEATEIDLIKDVICRAEVVTMEAGALPKEESRMPFQLSETEKDQLIKSYTDTLKSIYTTSASQLNTYVGIRRQLMSSNDKYYDKVYDHGVFEIVLNNLKIKNDRAYVNATLYCWQKYITSGENSWFAVSFPVYRTTCDYELEKVNGVWLITSQTETDYVFDADGSLMKTFDNYVDAAEYAKSVTTLALGKSDAVQPERAVPSKPSEAALIPAPEMPQASEYFSDFSGTAISNRPSDLDAADSREAEEWLSGFAVRAKFVRNTGTRMDPDLKAPVTEAEFRVLEVCQGEFDGDILVTEYNGGTVSMKDYADVYGKDSVEKLGFGDLTDEKLESKTFTDPYEGEDRFDFEKNDPDTEYLIYVAVNTDTGKTWLGNNGLSCLEIKNGLVTSPFTGETMTVSEMLNNN